MSILRILAVGDVVGQEATAWLERRLWKLRRERHIDMAVVNGENAAEANGLDPQTASRILDVGADVITSGNHIWQKKSIYPFLEDEPRVLRPVNYPADAPGNGYHIVTVNGYRILIISVMGTVFLDALENPFAAVDRVLAREASNFDIALLDIHAEATAEKIAMGYYFDGRISCIWGTHTHVQTADEQILPNGSGYITDLGMTGPMLSVLGVERDIVIQKFRSCLPVRFETAKGNLALHGAIYTVDTDTKKTTQIERIVLRDGEGDCI